MNGLNLPDVTEWEGQTKESSVVRHTKLKEQTRVVIGGGADILITSHQREFAADCFEFRQQEFGSLHFTTETATRSVCIIYLYIYMYCLSVFSTCCFKSSALDVVGGGGGGGGSKGEGGLW